MTLEPLPAESVDGIGLSQDGHPAPTPQVLVARAQARLSARESTLESQIGTLEEKIKLSEARQEEYKSWLHRISEPGHALTFTLETLDAVQVKNVCTRDLVLKTEGLRQELRRALESLKELKSMENEYIRTLTFWHDSLCKYCDDAERSR